MAEQITSQNDKAANELIGLRDHIVAYCKNYGFRRIVDSGNFTFVADRLLINDEIYVQKDEYGKLSLTPYAQANQAECCLIIPKKLDGGIANDRDGSNCISDSKKHPIEKPKTPHIGPLNDPLHYKPRDPHRERPAREDDPNMAVFERSEELKILRDGLAETIALSAESKSSFSKAAWMQITRCHCTNKNIFCERTLLSEKTFDRIKVGILNSPDLETVMALCIGLDLGALHGIPLLKCAGYDLASSSNRIHTAYNFLLCTFHDHSIYEWNAVLEALQLPLICGRAYHEMKA